VTGRWLAPADIALGLGLPDDGQVLDALASLELTESRAHSKIEGVRVYSPAAVALVEQRIRSKTANICEDQPGLQHPPIDLFVPVYSAR
jgi:hypothetical protein